MNQIKKVKEKLSSYTVDKNDNLTNEELILLVLDDVRCINSEQVMKLLNYKNRNAANVALRKIELKQLIYSVNTVNYSSLGKTYFLTNTGIEKVLSLKGRKFYIQDQEGKMVYNAYTQGYNRLDTRMIPHTLSTNEYYINYLMSEIDEPIEWKDSRGNLISNESGSLSIRPDATIKIKDHTYLVEQDMGTETKTRLLQKFGNYGKVLASKDLSKYTLFFSIDLKKAASIEVLLKNSSEVKKMKSLLKEEKSLLSRYLKIKELAKLYPKPPTDEEIESELNGLNALLKTTKETSVPIFTKKEKEKMQQRIKELENFKNGAYPKLENEIRSITELIASNIIPDKQKIILAERLSSLIELSQYKGLNIAQEIKEKRSHINQLEKKIRMSIEDQLKSNLKSRYKLRCQSIWDIIMSSGNEIQESLIDNTRFLDLVGQGLDIYIADSDELIRFMMDKIIPRKRPLDLCENMLDKHFQPFLNQSLSIKKLYKKCINGYSKESIADLVYELNYRNQTSRILIFDATYGNYGANYRIDKFMSSLDSRSVSQTDIIICLSDEIANIKLKDGLELWYGEKGSFTGNIFELWKSRGDSKVRVKEDDLDIFIRVLMS